VRQHQIALQLGQALVRNLGAGELAKAGVDAIDDLVFIDDALHRGQGLLQTRAGRRIEHQLHRARVDAAQLGQRDAAGVQGEG